MILHINIINVLYNILLQHIYIKKNPNNLLYLMVHVYINLGRKSGTRKGECFLTNIEKDKISHLQEGIKAKTC